MISELLQGLNPKQQEAVQAVKGPVLVLAGPGSGKTRVLTQRIAYLIEEEGVDPFNILAVTFTNKAAQEMKDRLEALLGPGRATALTVGTFHSVCSRFLRREIKHLGRSPDFTIYDSDDQLRLVKRVLRDLNLDEKQNLPRTIQNKISKAKNEMLDAAKFAQSKQNFAEQITASCYERYQELLLESNALDFDDLLMTTVQIFRQFPEVLAAYQQRYTYLLVDEYQDTNRVQYLLVKNLAAQGQNVFVVGDNDQSVYSFRGADVRNILQFERDYPTAQVILLEQNYRSTQAILDVAQAVIKGGKKQKYLKSLWTEKRVGVKVSLQEGYDPDDEARLVVTEIERLRRVGSYQLNDFALIYRTNAQSRALEEAFLARGLRYQIIGGIRFYERKEIKDVLAYLRLLHNPFDRVSLERVLATPGRGIGSQTEAELQRWATAMGVPIYQSLLALANLEQGETPLGLQVPFNTRARKALLSFLKSIEDLRAISTTFDLVGLIDALLEQLKLQEILRKEYGQDEGEERWANILELRNVAGEFTCLPREQQLATFLAEVALVSDTDSLKDQAEAVTCITLHQAKGLEYPVVFLIGLEEGLLPHSRSLDNQDTIEEERRLFYVGATRAKERLYLLYTFRRSFYGQWITSTPSRFLADIPPDLINRPAQPKKLVQPPENTLVPRNGPRLVAPLSNQGPSEPRRLNSPISSKGSVLSSGPTERIFLPGQRVRHQRFGEGVVVSSKLVEDDEEVTVDFLFKGQKRMLANLAKLEQLEP